MISKISIACPIGMKLNPILLILNLMDMPGINCIRALRKNVTLILEYMDENNYKTTIIT